MKIKQHIENLRLFFKRMRPEQKPVRMEYAIPIKDVPMAKPIYEFPKDMNALFLLQQGFVALEYKMRKTLHWLMFFGILFSFLIPLSILVPYCIEEDSHWWEVTDKKIYNRSDIEHSYSCGYEVQVKRNRLLRWIEVPWDMFDYLEEGYKVKLNYNDEITDIRT